MITQEQLKEILHYDPETGSFTWAKSGRRIKIGKVAGGLEKGGYIRIRIFGKMYFAHRLAWLYMTGSFPPELIDHDNGNPSDNRFVNLREATRSENQANRGKTKANASGFKGVYWDKKAKKWKAQIGFESKTKYLGLFDTKEEAHDVYKKAADNLHGKFARHK
ncbi:MAG: HNH endonuclease [Candidatus Omnitrophota bacterium]